jgi:glycosyltransferase involved in cell wall biosynthesis
MQHFMNATQPFVSVIMPIHNGERFLAGAIENIKRQNYRPLEIIVIDDGSTDGTPTIARQFKEDIRYISQEKRGSFAARNVGVKMAKGDIIAFLDVDDLWAEYTLSKQVQHLNAYSSVDIVQGLIQEMTLEKVSQHGDWVFKKSSDPYQFINVGSAVYRKEVFKTVGLFDENLKQSADTDWYYRAWRKNVTKHVIKEVALLYRKHDSNVTLGYRGSVYFGLLRLSKKYIDSEKQKNFIGSIDKANLADFREFMGAPPGRRNT